VRHFVALVFVGLLGGAGLGCAGPGQSLRKTDATLLVECPVASASIYVDESFAGRAGELSHNALRVAHGTLRIEVRAEGYFPAYRDVTVRAGEQGRVSVELRAVPEGES
jgi:hypothetical protein